MSALEKDAWRITFGEVKAAAEDIIEEARKGRMFILVDDEDRENEGDLVVPAQWATPEAINFMAKHARGLICLALTRERVEQLGLPLMAQNNGTRHQTAFTVSIEAREGVTTGISAADRARTVSVAIDPSCGPQDIVTPGHVFPLVARDGGTLERTGHTEAAVDLARLAGLTPAGVVCEIMNDDGTMARRNDLITFAQRHGLKIGTISDLIAYRRRYDSIIKRISERPSCSTRSRVSARQIRPRACLAMKLIASGVAHWAGITRSPSFSRSSSSTRMNIRPLRASSMMSSAAAFTSEKVTRQASFSSALMILGAPTVVQRNARAYRPQG